MACVGDQYIFYEGDRPIAFFGEHLFFLYCM